MRAVVTGAGSGIGHAIADAYRRALWDVVSLDIAGVPHAYLCDVRNIDAVGNAIAAAWPFDVLVNAAGVAGRGEFAEITPSEIDRVLGVNFGGTAHACRLAAQWAIDTRQSLSIVNVASMSGLVANGPGFHNAHYCASKAAVLGLTRALAVEWAPLIRVNAVAPGPIDTPMLRAFAKRDPVLYDTFISRVPLGRPGTAEEVASAVLWLASAEFCTGSTLVIDGGYTAC